MLWERPPNTWLTQRQDSRLNSLDRRLRRILSSDVAYKSRVKANVPNPGQVKAEWGDVMIEAERPSAVE